MQKYKGKNLHFRLLNHSVEIKKKMPDSVSIKVYIILLWFMLWCVSHVLKERIFMTVSYCADIRICPWTWPIRMPLPSFNDGHSTQLHKSLGLQHCFDKCQEIFGVGLGERRRNVMSRWWGGCLSQSLQSFPLRTVKIPRASLCGGHFFPCHHWFFCDGEL